MHQGCRIALKITSMKFISYHKILILATLFFFSVNKISSQKSDPAFIDYINNPWVDSVFKSLTLEERIAQLIWVAAYSNRDLSYEVNLSKTISSTGIGGLIFFQDDPVRQSEMINHFNSISKVPLIIGMDGEWGVGMRLSGVPKFPYQMTLGAIKNDTLIYKMGAAVAKQFLRTGMHINLAPVADVNNNRQNTVINYRSFGEDPEITGRKATVYMKGLQDNGILAVAKHFPGHGDTETDSHVDLPVLKHSSSRLDSIELVPFRKLINEGVAGVMPGHLNIPSLDPSPGIPATLSYRILTGMLIKDLAFRGIVISDAMNMGALTKYYASGEVEASALKAGMDVLEFVTEPELAIKVIAGKVRKGELSENDINFKCRKVLAAKYWSGLNRMRKISTEGIIQDLSSGETNALIRDLYSNAMTVLSNNDEILPVKDLSDLKIAAVAVNRSSMTAFQKRLETYHKCDFYYINPDDTASVNNFKRKRGSYNLVIAGIYGLDQRPSAGFGIKPNLAGTVEMITETGNSVITWFGNPYGIDRVPSLQQSKGLILAYQENEFTEELAAQLIFGATGASGILPVTINSRWPAGFGIETPGGLRMQYGYPENAGIDGKKIEKLIDNIANEGLAASAFPGCEVMIARKGICVFQKTYGYQTYENRIAVREDDLYDLASVTKVAATLPALMILDSQGLFSPDKKLGEYLPEFRKSDKGDITLREMLTHQAGLTAWIPFWQSTVRKNGKFRRNVFSDELSEKYPLEVAEGIFINRNYSKKILKEIRKSPLGERKYLYSDLTFIMAPWIIENLSGQKWNEYVEKNIFKKLGASDMTFNPYLKYNLSRIVPTEYDSLFRKQLLHGTVHDEGAAMLGGISGHAGLFATANDLMKLMEMYRRMGKYGSEQIISEEVMAEYTKVQFPENKNRRALGFDKPLLNNTEVAEKDAYPTKSASPGSFGHSGYTGTFVWVDPEHEISYVFLCNRVYPTRNNNLLSQMNIRSRILESVYQSVIE